MKRIITALKLCIAVITLSLSITSCEKEDIQEIEINQSLHDDGDHGGGGAAPN